LDGVLEYLPIFPLIVISFTTLGYILSRLYPKWTKPFIKEEPTGGSDTSDTEKNKPSLFWSIVLVILAATSISISIIQLLKWQELRQNAIFRLASWAQVILVLALNRPRYCPEWLSGFFFICISVDSTMVQSWTDLRDPQVLTQIASTTVTLLSFAIVMVMPFRPISPASGPIGVSGTVPSIEKRSPEDSLRLWQFLTTSWVWPLLSLGKARQMQKEDVWKLGFGFQSSRIIAAFHEVKKSTLFTRLVSANKLDLTILVFAAFVRLVCGKKRHVITEFKLIDSRTCGACSFPTVVIGHGRSSCSKSNSLDVCTLDIGSRTVVCTNRFANCVVLEALL
jgi:hypothetical protein